MALIDYFRKSKPSLPDVRRGVGVGAPQLQLFTATRPTVAEQKGKEWVMFNTEGTSDNAYPYLLQDFFDSCPLHAAIVTAKAKLAAGDAILFDGQEASAWADVKYLDGFLGAVNRDQDLHQLLDQASLDLQVYGAMAFEMVWSLDFSRVVEIIRVNPADVRVSESGDRFFVCEWNSKKKEEPRVIPAFDPGKATQFKQPFQLLYVRKSSNLKFYGLPEYVSALESIALEKSIIEFHKASLENQFAPSLVLTFPERPRTAEEADEFFAKLKSAYGGSKNAGKPLVLFGENATLPDVTTVESARLDERLINLKDSVTESIIYGHRVSSPALLGIAIPGKLGMSQELPTAFKIFDKTVVGPDRRLLERTFTALARQFGVPMSVTIKPFNPIA
jgi:hypothetical protein